MPDPAMDLWPMLVADARRPFGLLAIVCALFAVAVIVLGPFAVVAWVAVNWP